MLVHYLLGFTDLISGIIALLVSAIAYNSYKTVKEKVLLYLGLSFSMIGIGILMKSFSLIFLSRRTLPLFVMCSLLNIFSKNIAYLLLALIYTIQVKSMYLTIIVFTPTFSKYFIFPFSHIISIALLGYIIFHLIIVYIHKKNPLTILVIIAFIFLLISHLFSLLSYIAMGLILTIASSLTQLIGFLFLLYMLVSIHRR